jgi:glycosyltransferase 2 family protein
VRTLAIRLLQIALAAGLIGLLVRAGLLDLRELGRVGERWPWLLAAEGCFALLLLFATTRWHLLMRARGIQTRFRDTAAILLVGWLFNQTMPSSTGGDVAKAVAVALEHPERRSGAVMSIAMDRFIGLSTLLAFTLAAATLNADLVRSSVLLGTIVRLGVLALAGVLVATLLFYSKTLRGWLAAGLARLPMASRPRLADDSLLGRLAVRAAALIQSADEAVYAYRSHPGTILACIALSIGLHSMTVAVNLCLTWALLGTAFDWVALLALIPMAHAGLALGITPGAIGVAEAIYTQLFAIVGISQGALVCVLQRLIWYSWALVGAVIFSLRRSGPRARDAISPPRAIATSGAERLR